MIAKVIACIIFALLIISGFNAACAFDIDIFINQDLTAIRKRISNNDFKSYEIKQDAVLNDAGGIFGMPVISNTSDKNKIYFTFFKPYLNANWNGNLKKFTIKDGNPEELLNTAGNINLNAVYEWHTGDGSNTIESGGANEIILNQMSARRKIYTYIGAGNPDITALENSFDINNSLITTSMLNVYTEDERNRVITFIRKAGFGAVLHSKPAIAFYPAENRNVIFIGTNNGVLHCIDDISGEEFWAFIFPEHLPKLKILLNSNVFLDAWFVDNVPVIKNVNNRKILICGSRRGGYAYVALDITDFRKPVYLYSTPKQLLEDSPLGLSWGIPVL